jgi:myo-inositol 2-dehydrogenase/D-chiro-inositol 1-dehydrogenase
MISIGLLGCGRIGQVHARGIVASRRANLVAVSDAMPEAANSLAEETGSAARTVERIFADDAIDAVIIGTPTDSHAAYIEAASAAGKAVLCEKPLDLSADRIRACLANIENSQTPLMIGFQRRFDVNFANIQTRLKAGEIGDVELITLTSRDPAPPPISYVEKSGGIFADMMIHDLDMARFLLGEEPSEVQAAGSTLVDPTFETVDDFDTAAVILKTESGKICQISCSRRAAYGYDQRIEVHGSKGLLRAANIHETTVESADANGFTVAPLMNFFLERYMPAYRAELDYFIDCIENGIVPSPSGDDGLRAQMLADAASQASRTGMAVKIGK